MSGTNKDKIRYRFCFILVLFSLQKILNEIGVRQDTVRTNRAVQTVANQAERRRTVIVENPASYPKVESKVFWNRENSAQQVWDGNYPKR